MKKMGKLGKQRTVRGKGRRRRRERAKRIAIASDHWEFARMGGL
jgi:hypothetical protein